MSWFSELIAAQNTKSMASRAARGVAYIYEQVVSLVAVFRRAVPDRYITVVPTVGAGQEFVVVVPAGKKWAIQSASVVLVTGVTVATRLGDIVFDDGTNIFYAWLGVINQAANITKRYVFGTNLQMNAGWRMRSVVPLLKPVDQFAPVLMVGEWDV